MRSYWYPIGYSDTVPSGVPYAMKLLGDPLVLFRDSEGTVHCLADLCPHRSTKLSKGSIRLEAGGVIECLYHGWQFQGATGQCVRIPSLPPEDGHTTHKVVKAIAYPCIEKLGTIWVWPGDPQFADPKKIPSDWFWDKNDTNENQGKFVKNQAIRELDIDHELMVENLTDPAHLPFTHVGTL